MIVQSPQLGVEGRFANWLIQYMLSLQFAMKHGARLQTPPWIGELLFGIRNERITEHRPFTKFSEDGSFAPSDVIVLDMFFKLPKCMHPDLSSKAVRWTFKWEPQFDPIKVPEHYVVVHNRQGDFRETKHWPHLEIADQLAECNKFGFANNWITVLSEDISVQQVVYAKNFDFLYDFQRMIRAKHLFVYPNSTFSYLASRFSGGRIYMPSGYSNGPTKAVYTRDLCLDR